MMLTMMLLRVVAIAVAARVPIVTGTIPMPNYFVSNVAVILVTTPVASATLLVVVVAVVAWFQMAWPNVVEPVAKDVATPLEP